MKRELSGYPKYYQRALELNVNGYKPVAGGTGLGKTHGAIECIKRNRYTHKFIYVSHRHNLLEEMAAKLAQEGINYRYLKNDTEVIKLILKEKYENVKCLLNDATLKDYAQFARIGSNGEWRYDEKKCLKWIADAQKILQLQAENKEEALDPLNPEEELGKKASLILSFFKKIFFSFSEVHSILSSDDHSRVDGFNFQANDIQAILANYPVIFDLFPYWEYQQSNDITVALVTIHKLFLGYFDGRRNVNIHIEKDRVIFLDEFEFLESELLKLIISESKLDNPFVFIAYFYHNMRVKLLDEKYLSHYPEIKDKLEVIVLNIERLKQLSFFPEIRSFGMKDEEMISNFIGSGLYQANYTSVERPIYLEIDNNLKRYWLVEKPNRGSLTTFQLMRSVKRISNRILQFFLALKIENEKIYYELVEDAYEKTEYLSYLNKLSFFSVVPSNRRANGYERVNNFSYLYHKGYGVYVLNKTKTNAEPNEVFLDFHMVNSSPERCLLGLIRKNLVFGLSATAHIPRCLEHFNETWIKEEIEFEAKDNVCYLDLDEVDKEIIRSLSEEKATKRSSQVEVTIAEGFCREPLISFVKKLQANRKVPQVDATHDYHASRLIHFFGTLDWIQQNPTRKNNEVDSHLIFFNSITQVKICLNLLESGYNLLPQVIIHRADLFHYDVRYFGHEMRIILFDSKAHKYYFDSEVGKKKYNNLFSSGKTVILVTQYPSANNGVNLQYLNPNTGSSEDYQNIHLLEAPHFYFSHGATRTENEIKEDIWKLSQLVLDLKIPKSEFSQKIKKITVGSNELNNLYKDLNDYTLNQIAKIIQALGRIERTSQPVELQRGRVSKSVLKIFCKYFYNPEIQSTIAGSSPYLSTLVQTFFAELKKHCDEIYDKNNRERPSGILDEDSLFKKQFKKLLTTNQDIREGVLKHKKSEECIRLWHELRKSALSFDFNSNRIKEIHGTFYSKHLCLQNGISWCPKTGKIAILKSGQFDGDAIQWEFNAPFRKLVPIEEVRRYFSSQGYVLEFRDRYNFRFFTPSFYQQIYLGALGEEASKAMFLARDEKFEVIYPEEVSYELFEVVDFVIPEKNWFVDAKFYSEANMLGIKQGGFLSRKLKSDVKSKIQKIRKFNPNAKLVIINANSDENGCTTYFNKNFKVVEEGTGDVIVFPGLLQLREYLEEFV